MAEITLKGAITHTIGDLPGKGEQAPGFLLTGSDLADRTLDEFRGANLVLNIFPSLDTDVCAASVRQFNKLAGSRSDTRVLCISRDLPFAHKRFCVAEGIEGVVSLSELRGRDFGKDYGVEIVDGPLKGLLARAVLVLDAAGKVLYTEMVPEIAQEPDYEAALDALR